MSAFSERHYFLGRRQANLCFHFAGSGENLPDIAKSRDARLDSKLFGSQLKIPMKQNCFLFQRTSCHFFQSRSRHKLHKTSFNRDMKSSSSRHQSGLTLLTSTLQD